MPETKSRTNRKLEWQRNDRKRKRAEKIDSGELRTCESWRCDVVLRSDNVTNHCMTKEACLKEHNSEYWAHCHPWKKCEVCDGRVRKDSIYKVCGNTAKCRKELRRRKSKAKWKRDSKKILAANRRRYRDDPAYREKCASYQKPKKRTAPQPTATRLKPEQFIKRARMSLASFYRYCKKDHPNPALTSARYPDGRHIQTWPDKSERSDRKPFLASAAHADKIAAVPEVVNGRITDADGEWAFEWEALELANIGKQALYANTPVLRSRTKRSFINGKPRRYLLQRPFKAKLVVVRYRGQFVAMPAWFVPDMKSVRKLLAHDGKLSLRELAEQSEGNLNYIRKCARIRRPYQKVLLDPTRGWDLTPTGQPLWSWLVDREAVRPLLGGNGQPAPADPKVTTASNGHTPTANTPDAETKSAPTGQSATSNQKHFRPAGEPEVPSNALLSVSDLAKQFVVKATALGMQLNRFRLVQANHRHWREMEDTKPRDSKFLYRVSAVMPIIRKLQAKRQR